MLKHLTHIFSENKKVRSLMLITVICTKLIYDLSNGSTINMIFEVKFGGLELSVTITKPLFLS